MMLEASTLLTLECVFPKGMQSKWQLDSLSHFIWIVENDIIATILPTNAGEGHLEDWRDTASRACSLHIHDHKLGVHERVLGNHLTDDRQSFDIGSGHHHWCEDLMVGSAGNWCYWCWCRSFGLFGWHMVN